MGRGNPPDKNRVLWTKSPRCGAIISMTKTMPTVFIGHGSPMNAIESNDYTRTLNKIARELPRPRSVLCISAHWMTSGIKVTHMRHPKTIHDFYGFPRALFDIQYLAPGDPTLAERVKELIPETILDDADWGLDHGCWSVLRHMYPQADIPVVQLSLDAKASSQMHFETARKLSPLRDEGVLIFGSGNIVHNLARIHSEIDAPPFDWAIEFDTWFKNRILAGDMSALLNPTNSEAGRLSIPTSEHYLPVLYTLGSSRPDDRLEFLFEGIQNASISMRSFSYNSATERTSGEDL